MPWGPNESRLKSFLAVVCWDGDGYNHRFWSFYIALPAAICWCVLLPILGMMIIFKKKKAMNDIDNRLMFGFFCMGYRGKKIYWYDYFY